METAPEFGGGVSATAGSVGDGRQRGFITSRIPLDQRDLRLVRRALRGQRGRSVVFLFRRPRRTGQRQSGGCEQRKFQRGEAGNE
jgi:hypothetical protein